MAVEMMGTEDSVFRYLWLLLPLHAAQEFLSTTAIITTTSKSFRKFLRPMYLVVVMSAVERWKAVEVLGGKSNTEIGSEWPIVRIAENRPESLLCGVASGKYCMRVNRKS